MLRFAAFVVLAAGLVLVTDARYDLQRDLRQTYTGKVLLLRVPSNYDILHFDSHGQPTRPGTGEPWTTCGLLRVKKIAVSPRQVGIDGERVVVVLNPDPSAAKLRLVNLERPVHVTIDLPSSVRDATELNGFMEKLFEPGDPLERMAAAWKAEVDLNLDLDEAGKTLPDGRVGTLADERPVYLATAASVKAPHAVYKPGPKYSEKALIKRIAGTIRVRMVVNENGYPEILEVIKHLREGLDTRALAAVAQWRFKPALRNGKPVAAMLIVDVKFRLR